MPIAASAPSLPEIQAKIEAQRSVGEQLAREAAQPVAPPPPATPRSLPTPNKDPRNANTYTFTVDVTDPHGTRFSGTFTVQIPTTGMKIDAASLRATLTAGKPITAFLVEEFDRADIMAQLQKCMVEGMVPDWAKNGGLYRLEDDAPLMAIWKEVSDHRDFYFRRGAYAPENAAAT